MAKSNANTELCKGCRLCIQVCPKQAIIPLEDLNKAGYKIIAINTAACIGCGMCYRMCPDYVFSIEQETKSYG